MRPGPKPRSLSDRFHEKVRRSNDCWEWVGAIHHSGYGAIKAEGGRSSPMIAAHRVAWLLCFGEIPVDMSVLHKCDNRSCVRPDHLFLGTQQDNVDDCISKGRNRCGRLCGEDNGCAKLKEIQVLEIRREYREKRKMPTELSRLFGVSRQTVKDIISYRKWRHVA